MKKFLIVSVILSFAAVGFSYCSNGSIDNQSNDSAHIENKFVDNSTNDSISSLSFHESNSNQRNEDVYAFMLGFLTGVVCAIVLYVAINKTGKTKERNSENIEKARLSKSRTGTNQKTCSDNKKTQEQEKSNYSTNPNRNVNNVKNEEKKHASNPANEESLTYQESQDHNESISNKKEKTKVKEYKNLTVFNRTLTEADECQNIYYRAWTEKGKVLFEFVNNEKTAFAINNRSIIIDPFCDRIESSKLPDDSVKIVTKTPGELEPEMKKAKIMYI